MGFQLSEATRHDDVDGTADSGADRSSSQPPEGGFFAVTVLGKDNLWAIGHEGHYHTANISSVILNSTDLGFTWKRKARYINQYLYDIYFHNALNGWAVGWQGLILRTTDGGQTWVKQRPPIGDESLVSVRFVSEKVGWALGRGGQVLRTTNGGSSWRSQMLPAGWIGMKFRGWLNSLSFGDESNGWVVGDEDHIYQSTDGGASWHSRSSEVKPLIKVDKVWCVNSKVVKFFNRNLGYLIVEVNNNCDTGPLNQVRRVAILKTENGGKSWMLHQMLELPWVHHLQFLTETEWWMQVPTHPEEFLYHTTDAGKNWTKVKISPDTALNLVVFLDSNTGLSLSYDDGFSGDNLITRDGGKTWLRNRIKYLIEDDR